MLPLGHQIAFLIYAFVAGAIGTWGFYRLYRRIRAGRHDNDERWDRLPARIWYAFTTALLQKRTFRKRPIVGLFHGFIFYGFTFYLLVNCVDAAEGFLPIDVTSASLVGKLYNLAADVLSFLVLVGVVALIARRFFLPSRRDFQFNERTLLHEDVQTGYIRRDSLIVSIFILFHVGSRILEEGAKRAIEGPDSFQPFASLVAHALKPSSAAGWEIFGFWGALGSILAFLMYFPYTKHVHILMAPLKYLVARESDSGVLPALEVKLESDSGEEPLLGAKKLEDLGWPRLLDAYACIQCNRCQDVCPAAATGKSLSPAALEINKRMELNRLTSAGSGFEKGSASPRPLLSFALSPEAAWACTTCGACMQVCPVQDEQMLDIVDIRRNQVMMEGEFPSQLQNAFRGMERTMNPWGINHDQRMAWADGLNVPTIEENPDPDVLYWVGCAASYDPQSQKTARALVQLLAKAKVNFAVLGKKECCTGDTARRTGNEYLYTQLAQKNIATLNTAKPKMIVATCPHCMNALSHEYRQLGGAYKVVHHSQFLAELVKDGRLSVAPAEASVTYHDPCYLGRHNGVYEAPRNLLHILSNDVVELPRARENSFCCGAGGGQFWKEEEPGTERVSANRYREVEETLDGRRDSKFLAVGCPFCKSMLGSSPGKDEKNEIAIKDVAELLLEGVLRYSGEIPLPLTQSKANLNVPAEVAPVQVAVEKSVDSSDPIAGGAAATVPTMSAEPSPATEPVERKKWTPQKATPKKEATGEGSVPQQSSPTSNGGGNGLRTATPSEPASQAQEDPAQPARKKWAPKAVGSAKKE